MSEVHTDDEQAPLGAEPGDGRGTAVIAQQPAVAKKAAVTPAKTAKADAVDEYPQGGGSFVRHPDGTLQRAEEA